MNTNEFVQAITRIEGDGSLDPATKAIALAAVAQEFAASTADAAVAHVEAAKPAPEVREAAKPTVEDVKLGLDDFTRDLTGQAHLDNAGMAREKIAARIGPDLVNALVNKADPERDAKYGPLWQGVQLENALKIENLVIDRQAATWDIVNDKPTESLADSVTYARYNSWTAGGNYIFDTLYSGNDLGVAGSAAPGEPGYRSPPGKPGYTGPYLTRSGQ